MNKYIISYTAGYIDGDGCFCMGQYISTKGIISWDISIQVCSVKVESLTFFKKHFGGSIRSKPKRPYHKQIFAWKIRGIASYKLSIEMQKFLTDKRLQCLQYIEMRERIVPNNFKKVHEVEQDIRNRIMEELKEDKHVNYLVTKEIIERIKDIDTIAPIKEDWAYLAGLIDAEGCFRIKKWKPVNKPNYVYAICLEIGNTRYPMFEFLMERFGGNICYVPPKKIKRASAIWSISSFALSQIITNILPYIIIKKAAAEKIIEFYNTTLSNGGDRHSQEFKESYARKLIEREKIVDEIHNLNLKGLKV